MDNSAKENIHEALKYLEDVASDATSELSGIIKEKYPQVRDIFDENLEKFRGSIDSLSKRAKDELDHARTIGKDKTKRVIEEVDKDAHHHPWTYIGLISITSLLLGYILGRKR